MLQTERHQRFKEAVESLKLKFPGQEIVKRTGYHKATVSSYLGEREPSEDFIKTFSEKFGLNFQYLWYGKTPDKEIEEQKTRSLDRLAQALADQAAANKIQAAANDKHAEGYVTLAEAYKEMLQLLRDMRNNIATETVQKIIQEKVQTTEVRTDKIELNLEGARETLAKLERRQELAIEELRDQFEKLGAQKKVPSRDARKKAGRTDENG